MSFPAIRMRRMRRDAFSRALMRENTLLPSDLIMVAFVIEGEGQREAVHLRRVGLCQRRADGDGVVRAGSWR